MTQHLMEIARIAVLAVAAPLLLASVAAWISRRRAVRADPIDDLIRQKGARWCRDGDVPMDKPDMATMRAVGQRRWRQALAGQLRTSPVIVPPPAAAFTSDDDDAPTGSPSIN